MRLIDVDALAEKLNIKENCKDCVYSTYNFFCGRKSDFVDACDAIFGAPIIDHAQPERMTFDGVTLYRCDPEKNPTCAKTGCYINGGECRMTTKIESAMMEQPE